MPTDIMPSGFQLHFLTVCFLDINSNWSWSADWQGIHNGGQARSL